ncbi:MAG: hypothetical protein LC804_13950, partial [Acidobacteria bacterium]|nr:hypothetical protein [Acidobacteriota bacterium]
MTKPNRVLLAVITAHLCSGVASAQSAAAIGGPPAPTAPAMIARDAAGRATVRAIKLSEPLRMDGRLDEDVYR